MQIKVQGEVPRMVLPVQQGSSARKCPAGSLVEGPMGDYRIRLLQEKHWAGLMPQVCFAPEVLHSSVEHLVPQALHSSVEHLVPQVDCQRGQASCQPAFLLKLHRQAEIELATLHNQCCLQIASAPPYHIRCRPAYMPVLQ